MEANPFMPAPPSPIMTPVEVAEMLRLRESTVREYARRGVLPSFKLGRHIRFNRQDIVDFIDRQR